MFLNLETDLECLFNIRNDLEQIVLDTLNVLKKIKEKESKNLVSDN